MPNKGNGKIINRVIIYVRGEDDNWGDNVVAVADVQIMFPNSAYTALKGLKIVATANKSFGLVVPTVKFGHFSVPIFKGKEFTSIVEAAVLGTYNKLAGKCQPGQTWEVSRALGESYFGIARKEFSNAQYRHVKSGETK